MVKDLIKKRLEAFHPECLIRDISIKNTGEHSFKVSYIKVNKEDKWARCTLDVTIQDDSPDDYWDGDETDKISY